MVAGTKTRTAFPFPLSAPCTLQNLFARKLWLILVNVLYFQFCYYQVLLCAGR